MKRLWLRLFVLGSVAGPLAGCGTEPICTTDINPGVVVEIRDGFDDSAIAATARGAVHDGAFVDSLRPHGSVANGTLISRAAADERAGDYRVVVEHEGYLPWEWRALVRGGDCHVRTVHLNAYLTRTP